MSCIDVIFAAVLIVTLTTTWKLWLFQGAANHWVRLVGGAFLWGAYLEVSATAMDPGA